MYPNLASHFINDPYWRVRAQVAEHPEHAEKMLDDPHELVRANIAFSHPHLAEKLINNESEKVRSYVAYHSHLAKKLLDDPSEKVRLTIFSQHRDLAHHFINDPSVANRIMVTYYPEIAAQMKNDPDPEVREFANKNSKYISEEKENPPPRPSSFLDKKMKNFQRRYDPKKHEYPEDLVSYSEPFARAIIKKIDNADRWWSYGADAVFAKSLVHHGIAKAYMYHPYMEGNEHIAAKLHDDIAAEYAKETQVYREAATHNKKIAPSLINDPSKAVRHNVLMRNPELAHHFINDPSNYIRQSAKNILSTKAKK